jgi:SAM-dependent methyltransferase
MKQLLARSLPPWLLLRARQACSLPLDLRDWALRRRGPLEPPRWLRFLDGGLSAHVGPRFLDHFRRLAGLRPDEDVLDVGCGVGRLAVPLTAYLSGRGSYRGFDVVRPAVRWCQRHITPAFPRFRFAHADVRNAAYNPGGGWLAKEFAFPHPDGAFDFVFLTSVFTHMLPAEVAHYLREVARVLRPGGRCLATFFLLNAEARTGMAGPGSLYDFRHAGDGYRTTDPARPEVAVAYEEEAARAFVAAAGLELRGPVHYGSWSGRAGGADGQDLVVAWRP